MAKGNMTTPRTGTTSQERSERPKADLVTSRRYSDAEIEKAFANYVPFSQSAEGKRLQKEYSKAKTLEERELIQRQFEEAKKKYDASNTPKLEGALKYDKYYMSLKDFNNTDAKIDVYKVVDFDKDNGEFILRPVNSTSRHDNIPASLLGKNLVEMNKSGAYEKFKQNNNGDTFGGISNKEAQTLKTYTYAGAENSNLRKGKVTAKSLEVEDVINRTYYAKPFETYRGLKGDFAKKIANMKVGSTFTEKGFSSTGDLETAKKFGEKGVVLKIRVPSGYGKGVSVSEYSMHPEESEILLQRNSKFKITSKKGNIITVDMY